jgi:hypothetical protein
VPFPRFLVSANRNRNQKPRNGGQARRPNGAPKRKPRNRRVARRLMRGMGQGARIFGGAQRQVGAAQAYASGQVSKAPVIMASRDSSRIVHRELLETVVDSTPFAVTHQFAINPGLKATFPWLSTQALGWQAYRFNSLRFCYYTRSATTQVGSLMLIPDYDAADAAPSTEKIASSYEDVAEDSPWKDITCVLRPAAMDTIGPRHFVRIGGVPAGQDIKLFDVAQLFVASVGGTGGASIGKLWVEYDITFFTPQLPPNGVECGGATIVGATAFTAANPWGTAPVITPLGVTPSVYPGGGAGGNDILMPDADPDDEYLFVFEGTGTVLAALAVTVPAGGAIRTTLSSNINAAATKYFVAVTVTITDPLAFDINLAFTATTVTQGRVTIVEMPPSSPY